jgi:hypothetical protein
MSIDQIKAHLLSTTADPTLREKAQQSPRSSVFYGLSEIELNSFIPLKRACEISSLSEDTWRRKFPHLIHRLTERRSAVRLRDALFVNSS